jgi:ribosome biogenesis GTPase
MFLESLGADSRVRVLFEPYAARGLELARVAVAQRDHYCLFLESGETAARASGALRYRIGEPAAMPATGDWVAARIVGDGPALIEAVLPRKSLLSRRAAGRASNEQAIAANIDLLFVVCGLDGDFNLRRLERYLTLAAEAGTDAAVVLNKADLCAPEIEARLAATAAVARGIPVMASSTVTENGIDGLRGYLDFGRTVALLGSSGVGKSAIVNRLLGEERQQTAAVRESDSRGRHTSTRRELIPLPEGGALIDTPGMREIQLWAGTESVAEAFGEIVELAAACRFRDCSHTGEAGCAVLRAVEEGSLDETRLKGYYKLVAEARRHEKRITRAAVAGRKRKDKALHRSRRTDYRLWDGDP